MRCSLVFVFDNCTWCSNLYLLEYFPEELLTCIVETRAERCQNELIHRPDPLPLSFTPVYLVMMMMMMMIVSDLINILKMIGPEGILSDDDNDDNDDDDNCFRLSIHFENDWSQRDPQ